GVHYDPDIEHDYHIDRFAANFRGGGSGNNDEEGSSLVIQGGLNFIENLLPYQHLKNTFDDNIDVPHYNITINHGSEYKKNSEGDIIAILRTTSVKIFARKLIDHDDNPNTPKIPEEEIKDYTDEYIVPAALSDYIQNEN